MNKFINKYGLINSHSGEIVGENAPLNSLRFFIKYNDRDHLRVLLQYINNCRTKHIGLYNQFPFKVEGKDKYMSPDQLNAFILAFYKYEKKYKCKEIWNYIYRHFFTYNNCSPRTIDFKRTMQPKTIALSAYCSGIVFIRPILSIILIFSFLKKGEETSGKLKSWDIFKALNMKWTEKICTLLLRPWKSWDQVFNEYYSEVGHPLRLR